MVLLLHFRSHAPAWECIPGRSNVPKEKHMTKLRIQRKKGILSFEERYFEPVSNSHSEPLTIYYQTPNYPQNYKWSEFKTLHIDLSQSEDALLKDITKNTRYEINRFFKKDTLDCKIIAKPDIEIINTFANFYNDFAEKKGLKKCNTQKIERLAEKNGIIFSVVLNKHLNAICYHVFIVNGVRTRLLHSVSQFRDIKDKDEQKMIARANRGLHWFDMKYFKANGYKIYDMGGLADLDIHPDMASINKFKKGFGGKEVTEYNVYCSNTLLGRIASAILTH